MKFLEKYKFLGSSQNPEKLSESIRGVLIMSIPVIIGLTGVDIPSETLVSFVNDGMTFWGASVSLFGLGRKLLYKALDIINYMKND